MRRVGLTMHLVGGVVALAAVTSYPATSPSWWIRLVVGLIFVATAGLVLSQRAPGRRFLEGTAFGAVVLIGVMISVTEPVGMVPSFLFWPVGALAYFSTRRVVGAVLGVALAALVVGLVLNGHSTPMTFVLAAGDLVVMTWLVHTMTRHQNDLRAELVSAAATDPLTGLLNRRAFYPGLGPLVDDAAHGGPPLSVVVFDLDHFKQVNDTYGHSAGDGVLEHVGTVLREAAREEDLLARLGGEEFAVALPGAGPGDALRFATRVAACLRAVPGLVVPISTSAGICSAGPGAETTDQILGRADQALYAAKVAGRGRPATWRDQVEIGAPFVADAVPGGLPAPVGSGLGD